MTLRSPLLAAVPGLVHGFGDLRANVPAPFDAAPWGPWETSRRRSKQVHGAVSCELVARAQECGDADAFWTRAPGVPAGVMTADCVPVLLAHASGGACAAIHAGWRGTRARIVEAQWRELARALPPELARPSDWVAAIGPCIGSCCYEVSEELARDFAAEWPAAVHGRMLDLVAVNRAQLTGLGIVRVDALGGAAEQGGLCTRCALDVDGSPRFHSYRREGGGTRQWSVVGIAGG